MLANKKVLCIIQIRVGSTRLPEKALKLIGQDTLTDKVLKRVCLAKNIDQIVLAIPETEQDEILIDIASKYNIKVFQGSEQDVLDRFYKAALFFKGDIIIRITGDCPLIDPFLIDRMILEYTQGNYDYVSNAIKRSYPRGVDCEIFSFEVLKKVWENAKESYEREHVTPYIYEHPQDFTQSNIMADFDCKRPEYRICVDTKEDFLLISKIFEEFNQDNSMSIKDIVDLLDKRPDLQDINRRVKQKELKQ